MLKKTLEAIKFGEMKDKEFKVVQIVEKLCELCGKPLDTKERRLKTLQISSHSDYSNLLIRAKVHDRVEVDLENAIIYYFDHDYPGDAHPSCVEKYSEEQR